MDTKFTLLIPTKNRSETLRWCIQTCLEQDYDNYEIIVSDNNSEDDTREVVASFQNPKLIYYNTNESLGMTANYEFALSKVTEGFIAFIGDDDGIMPDALTTANQNIIKNKLNVLVGRNDFYIWNNFPIKSIQGLLKYDVNKKDHWISSHDQILKVLNQTFKYFTLPSIYNNAFVSMEIINNIKRKSEGVFFHSMIPDVYSAFAIAMEIDRFYYANFSFFLFGSSAKSNGASFVMKDTDKTYFNTFIKESHINFYDKLRQSPSMATYCSEAFYQASRHIKTDIEHSIETSIANTMKETLTVATFDNYLTIKEAVIQMGEINHIENSYISSLLKRFPYQGKYLPILRRSWGELNLNNLKDMKIIRDKANNIYDATLINYKLHHSKSNLFITNPITILFNVIYQKLKQKFS